MTPLSLKNVKISTVRPLGGKIEHPAILNASVFDLITLDSYIPLVFFYKLDKARDHNCQCDLYDELVEHLKECLGKVLVPFFPFGGRWVRTFDARIRELQCQDEGVPFIQAFIDEELESVVNWDEFVAVELLGGFKLLGLDPTVFNQDVDFPLPALFVQLTQFRCGGVALHMSFCHPTADGQGMVTFMKAWSETSLTGQTCIVPSHDRSLTTSLEDILDRFGASVILEVDDTEERHGGTDSVCHVPDPGAGFRFPEKEPMSLITLHVKRKLIEGLKRDAMANSKEITTVDLISAHIWRSINDLPESIDNKTTTVVGFWVNGRQRFHDPPLPENYCGNAIVLVHSPQIPSTELSSNSLLYAANIVHRTVKALNPLTWHGAMVSLFYLLENFNILDYRQIMITSWLRFPIYEISFGCGLGKPIFVCLNISYHFLPLGMVVILPPRPGLPVDAIATVQMLVQDNNGAAQALLGDQQFLSFFH